MSFIPKCPAPAPIGPIGARLVAAVDEGLTPTFQDGARLRDDARTFALAAVVDSPWNPTVARAAATMFHASRGSYDGATDASIRRRVDLLLAPAPLHEWERDQDRRAVLAVVLDMVAVMFMAGQRVHGDTGQPPISGMANTADALERLVNAMSRNLAADDYRAHYAGYPKEALTSAAFNYLGFVEDQIRAWHPEAPPRPYEPISIDEPDDLDDLDEPDDLDDAAGGAA